MTNADTPFESRAVVSTRLLPGPIERVWAYLTEPEKRGRWLATGEMELRVGGRVELRFRHAELSDLGSPPPAAYADNDQITLNNGHVTVCDPPHRLSFTWGENWGEPSEVAIELVAGGEDVLMTVTHYRLDSQEAINETSAGWHTHLNILEDELAGRPRRDFWAMFAAIQEDIAEFEREMAEDPDAPQPEPGFPSDVLFLTTPPTVEAAMLIRRPVAEVFEAFVDPAITTQFWFTKSSGRLEQGVQVRWDWEMFGATALVDVTLLEPNRRILMSWGDADTRDDVEWIFEEHGDGETFVIVANSGFSGTGDEMVAHAIGAMGGFSLVLAGAKAFLEHGIRLNLVADRFPDAVVSH